MIRQAVSTDKHALFRAANRFIKECYPERKVDVERLHLTLGELLGSQSHYAKVVEDKGEVKGALLALTGDHMWAQRKQSHVLLWYSDIPGKGLMLLKDYVCWVRERRSIRVAGLQPDFPISDKALAIAEAAGFKRYGGAYLLYN